MLKRKNQKCSKRKREKNSVGRSNKRPLRHIPTDKIEDSKLTDIRVVIHREKDGQSELLHDGWFISNVDIQLNGLPSQVMAVWGGGTYRLTYTSPHDGSEICRSSLVTFAGPMRQPQEADFSQIRDENKRYLALTMGPSHRHDMQGPPQGVGQGHFDPNNPGMMPMLGGVGFQGADEEWAPTFHAEAKNSQERISNMQSSHYEDKIAMISTIKDLQSTVQMMQMNQNNNGGGLSEIAVALIQQQNNKQSTIPDWAQPILAALAPALIEKVMAKPDETATSKFILNQMEKSSENQMKMMEMTQKMQDSRDSARIKLEKELRELKKDDEDSSNMEKIMDMASNALTSVTSAVASHQKVQAEQAIAHRHQVVAEVSGEAEKPMSREEQLEKFVNHPMWENIDKMMPMVADKVRSLYRGMLSEEPELWREEWLRIIAFLYHGCESVPTAEDPHLPTPKLAGLFCIQLAWQAQNNRMPAAFGPLMQDPESHVNMLKLLPGLGTTNRAYVDELIPHLVDQLQAYTALSRHADQSLVDAGIIQPTEEEKKVITA